MELQNGNWRIQIISKTSRCCYVLYTASTQVELSGHEMPSIFESNNLHSGINIFKLLKIYWFRAGQPPLTICVLSAAYGHLHSKKKKKKKQKCLHLRNFDDYFISTVEAIYILIHFCMYHKKICIHDYIRLPCRHHYPQPFQNYPRFVCCMHMLNESQSSRQKFEGTNRLSNLRFHRSYRGHCSSHSSAMFLFFCKRSSGNIEQQ